MKTLLLSILCGAAMASDGTFIDYQSLISKKPDMDGKGVRVWNMRKTDTIRINLVEFTAELPMHKHPDADHSLLVLEGRVRVQMGDKKFEIKKGDFISVPKDVPHKYWPLTKKAMLVSMDAPYYDSAKTIHLE